MKKVLSWGMVGGGRDSEIGLSHRMGAAIENNFVMRAGALDIDPQKARDFSQTLGIEPDRAYGDWREMLEGEKNRPDRIDLVTVATPNATHHEIASAFLKEGFHVLCEKPMTMTVEQGEDIVALSKKHDRLCVVNYCYSGYGLVRHMRQMIANGVLGDIRLVFTTFTHGHHSKADDQDNPRIRWRYDPSQAGVSSVMADLGVHAMHLATYVTGQNVTQLSADFAHCIEGRLLEDDAMVNFRLSGGTVGRLWASAIALGQIHGLGIQVFGEKGGIRWLQEQPNQIYWTRMGKPTQIIERGQLDLDGETKRVNRFVIGTPEGMTIAFANIYRDIADIIHAHNNGEGSSPEIITRRSFLPMASDGLRSVVAIHAAVESAKNNGSWVNADITTP